MLHETILAKHSVATLLQHCFEWFQHCSNIATLCWAKNRRCESSRVTSPQEGFTAIRVLVIRVYDFKELWQEYVAIKSRVTKIVNILIVSMKDLIISFSMSKDLHCRLCVLNYLITYCYSILYHKKTVFKRYNSATWKSLRQLNQPSYFVSETRVFKFSIGLNFNAVPFFLLIILGFRCSSFLRTFFISNWCIICV